MALPRPTEQSGPLAGHVRKGRIYRSQLAATGVLKVEDWVKNDLPDLVWPALVLAESGDDSVRRFTAWQKGVLDDLGHHREPALVAALLDGRLTNLAVLAERFEEAGEVVVTRARDEGLLSDRIVRALSPYLKFPAPWLLGDADLEPPEAQDVELLRDALFAAVTDGHREALIKALQIWSEVQAGTLTTTAETVELLKTFPHEATTRALAGSAIRAMWMARKGVVESDDSTRARAVADWARSFWLLNSITTACIRKSDSESSGQSDEGHEVPADRREAGGTTGRAADGGAGFQRFAMDLVSSFVQATETSPADLYSSSRQEVVTGLVCRAGRDLIAVLGAPDLWCAEHGSHIGRMLVEVRISLEWMAAQGPDIYRQYQEYGAGKAKLYARIASELPEQARTAGFRESVEELERLSHNNPVLDHRVVDTRDSFAGGKSIREMAHEVGLLDLYRQAYSLASGVAHSEWWSVEAHAMEPCLNVLHGLHVVPNMSLNVGANVELAKSWLDQLYALIQFGLSVVGAQEEAIDEAFRWMATSAEPGS